MVDGVDGVGDIQTTMVDPFVEWGRGDRKWMRGYWGGDMVFNNRGDKDEGGEE